MCSYGMLAFSSPVDPLLFSEHYERVQTSLLTPTPIEKN